MTERTKDQWVKRKTGNQGWMDSPLTAKILAILVAALASYTGYGEYQKTQGTETTVNVNLESVPDNVITHSHGAVTSKTTIERMIEKAVVEQHERDLELFKKKESWE